MTGQRVIRHSVIRHFFARTLLPPRVSLPNIINIVTFLTGRPGFPLKSQRHRQKLLCHGGAISSKRTSMRGKRTWLSNIFAAAP
jgi:hypothetical protein